MNRIDELCKKYGISDGNVGGLIEAMENRINTDSVTLDYYKRLVQMAKNASLMDFLTGNCLKDVKPTQIINIPKEKYKLVEGVLDFDMNSPLSSTKICRSEFGEYYHYKMVEDILNREGYIVNYV